MKRKFILAISITLTTFIFLNVLAYSIVHCFNFPTIHGYEDDHLGGYLHAKQWLVKHPAEIIFLGDSRTKYHIDTRWLNKQGIIAYNAGISGQFIELWPSAINHLIQYHPKYIILGMTVSDLYTPLYINSARTIGLADIKMLLATKQPISVVKNSIRPAVNASLPITYLKRLGSDIWDAYFLKSNTKFNSLLDCSINKTTSYKGGYIFGCENGDGVMTSDIKEDDFIKDMQMVLNRNPNRHTIRYLNEVINILKQNNIQPVVLLIPYFHKQFIFNPNDLKLIDCPVINLSNEFIDDKYKSYWANGSHFNEKGRAAFTKKLKNKLAFYLPSP